MNIPVNAPFRRGACPGLSTPMRTGDGLLARLMPAATISLDAMASLCAAARRHGNGVIEITARGSIQVRGLSAASAPDFADEIAQLGIAAHDGVPVIADPLAGLDPDEAIDAGAQAAELRRALAAHPSAALLSPKVSVAVDGGGALHLDGLAADVRLRAVASPDGARLHVGLGGDATTAVAIGCVTRAQAAATVVGLLDVIAAHGRDARARDVIRTAGIGAFVVAAGDRRLAAPPAPRPSAEPIGIHFLRDGTVAVGIGFAFGHTDAITLRKLIDLVDGAAGSRAAPGHALLVVGIAPGDASAFAAAAQNLGFITDPRDPRQRVVACAGAPICAAGEIPARALAPQVAQAAAELIGTGEVIHISGCAKSCAHRGPAALAAVGRAGLCDLLSDGAPAGSVGVDALPQAIARLARQRGAPHG